jgi:hypothetical protein
LPGKTARKRARKTPYKLLGLELRVRLLEINLKPNPNPSL